MTMIKLSVMFGDRVFIENNNKIKETGFLDLKYETFKTFKSLILVRLEFTSDWYQSKQKYG